MAPFQAKIGWKRPRKRKKNQKIKKYHCDFISSQNKLEKAEKEIK